MTTMAVPLRVLIADDDELLRDLLVEVFTGDPRMSVVAAVGDADAAIRAGARHQPSVALVDVKMPGGGGPRIAQELRSSSPGTRVVALSTYDDRLSISEMFRAGAVSYLVKGEASNEDIITTLVRVATGELVMPRAVGQQLLDELGTHLERAHAEEESRRGIEGRIRRVLADGQVGVVYQPIVDLRREQRCGVEALARFSQPPLQPPDRWFADAALVGLAVELELLAVRCALRAFDRLDPDTYLAVNVSPRTATDPAFHAMVLDGLPTATVMEITEHAPVDDYDRFSREIEPLRAAGVRLAIDDAGAGFASLRHIVLLAPDVIKLDLSLTRGIDVDGNRRAMARALISFAAETDATIVAEGIETPAELEALRELGVTMGQGYLLGRPAPLADRDDPYRQVG